MGAVLLLAAGWAAIVWSRPAPIRIAFANSLTGSSGPAGLENLVNEISKRYVVKAANSVPRRIRTLRNST
jgi:hypothetical protein